MVFVRAARALSTTLEPPTRAKIWIIYICIYASRIIRRRIKPPPVRERVSARTEREEAVPVEGTCALDRAPTQKNFTKNNFSIHHGSGRGSLSLLAVVLIFRPLPQRPLSTWRDFPAPSVGAVMREVGSVWFVYSTTLLEPAKGETDDLGYVTKRLALIFYTLFPTHILLGGGARWEMENGWKRIGACWEI